MDLDRLLPRRILTGGYYLLVHLILVASTATTQHHYETTEKPHQLHQFEARERHMSLDTIGMEQKAIVFLCASLPVIIFALAVVVYHLYKKRRDSVDQDSNPENPSLDPPPPYEKVVQEFDKLPRYSEVFKKRPASLNIKQDLPNVHHPTAVYQTKPVTPPPYPGPPLNSVVVHI